MRLKSLCAPAILYVAFSLTQIVIDIFKEFYNTAFLKLLSTCIITIALNMLCKRGLGLIAWLVVFLPFIAMTITTILLLFVFNYVPNNKHVGNTIMSIKETIIK